MPRQRIRHSRITYEFPDDFPQRLVRFKEASGLSWAELARRLGTFPLTVRRWWKLGVRPNTRHLMALLELAEDMGLAHLLTARQAPCEGPGVGMEQTGATQRHEAKEKAGRCGTAVQVRQRSKARTNREPERSR